MNVYDNYEISGCHRLDRKGRPHPNGRYIEICDDSQAQFWTIYGHIEDEGVEAIGDFSTRAAAEQVYSRTTGEPFTGSYQADARLRVMHAGPSLLAAAAAAWQRAANHEKLTLEECNLLRAAIADATGGTPLVPASPIVIEVRGGVVQDVLNVPPGCDYEIRDYDDIEADEEAAGRTA